MVLREAKSSYHATPSMTEDEFVEWCDGIRAEFVDGEVIIMSPDSAVHTKICMFLLHVLDIFVQKRDLGQLFGPNFQIRLRKGLRRVPDLLFVANERVHLIQTNHFEGAPDFAIEIVSPDSINRDWQDKFHDYEASGVPEYFVIDHMQQRMVLYRLIDGQYAEIKADEGVFPSEVIQGLSLRAEWFWQDPLPDPIEILKQLGVL